MEADLTWSGIHDVLLGNETKLKSKNKERKKERENQTLMNKINNKHLENRFGEFPFHADFNQPFFKSTL